MSTTTLTPVALENRAGEAHWFFGGLYTLKATAPRPMGG